MDYLVYLFYLAIIFHHVTPWTFPLFGALDCACRWKYGGMCKMACSRGEYQLGDRPCGFGYLGTCCVVNLSCVDYGGVCRSRGCSKVDERAYTYKVRCPGRQTCCLKKAAETGKSVFYRDVHETTSSYSNFRPRECGTRSLLRQRIQGGAHVYSSCQWPWMVSILSGTRFNPGGFVCAGVLISRNRVLTTARCVLRRQVFVTVGENDPNIYGEPWEQEINVKRVRISQAAGPGVAGRSIRSGDLAMLILESPVESRGCTTPVCLPRKSDILSDESRCFIAGWGRTYKNQNFSPRGLQEANVNIVNNNLCSLVMSMAAYRRLPVDKICSAPILDGVNTCPGDEGGMLVCEDPAHRDVWNLFGIISNNACSQTLPVVYTSVKFHLRWIEANL